MARYLTQGASLNPLPLAARLQVLPQTVQGKSDVVRKHLPVCRNIADGAQLADRNASVSARQRDRRPLHALCAHCKQPLAKQAGLASARTAVYRTSVDLMEPVSLRLLPECRRE